MKKLILALFVAQFVSAPCAQAYTGINVLAGLDFAKITEAGDDAYTPKHFLFGVTGEHSLLPYLAIESGLRYVQKGAGIRSTTGGIDLDVDVKINYLQIPAYLKMFFLDGSARPFIYMGPSFGFKLSDSVGVTATSGSTTVTSTSGGLLSGSLKSTVLCWDFGAGGRISVSDTMAVVLGLGYSLGLTAVNADASDTSSKTRDVELFAGMNFVL